MTPRITLIHGWGFDATLWRDVAPKLAEFEVELCDFGYFGPARLPQPCDTPRIAVGHSLGALWWLTQRNVAWRTLVTINGFARFTSTADFPQGIAPRVLQRMQKRFGEAPASVLADFRAACGASENAGPPLGTDTAPLAAGLAHLADLDGRRLLAQRHADVWALASGDDAVVPAALSEAAFGALPAGRLRWTEDGGHLLPLTHAEVCAALIREAARA